MVNLILALFGLIAIASLMEPFTSYVNYKDSHKKNLKKPS